MVLTVVKYQRRRPSPNRVIKRTREKWYLCVDQDMISSLAENGQMVRKNTKLRKTAKKGTVKRGNENEGSSWAG